MLELKLSVLPASMLILDVTPSDLSRPGSGLGLGCMLRTFLGVYPSIAESLGTCSRNSSLRWSFE